MSDLPPALVVLLLMIGALVMIGLAARFWPMSEDHRGRWQALEQRWLRMAEEAWRIGNYTEAREYTREADYAHRPLAGRRG